MRTQHQAPPILPRDSLARRDGKASRESFNRPPRVIQALPRDEVSIPAPPAPPPAPPAPPVIAIALPLLTGLAYLFVAAARGAGGGGLWLGLPIFAVSLVSAGVAVYAYLGQRRRHELQLSDYHELCRQALANTRARLEALERRQREILHANDPDVGRLLQIVGAGGDQSRPLQELWERRPGDADFLALRLGLGSRPTSVTIKTPETNLFHDSPALNEALELAAAFAVVPDAPITVALPERGSLAIAGPRAQALPLVRALLAQLVVRHAPTEVRLAAVWAEQIYGMGDEHIRRARDEWSWLPWLPHTLPLDGSDDRRLIARYDARPEHLRQLLDELRREYQERAEQGFDHRRQPHLVVLLDSYHTHGADYDLFTQIITGGRALGIYAICLVEESGQVPGACGAYVDLGQGCELVLAGPNGEYLPFRSDALDRQRVQQLAQEGLGSITLADTGGRRDVPREVRLLDLLGITDIDQYQPERQWEHPPAKSWHPVPLGLMAAGAPLDLDLNQDAHGAHGMIAGTTGSGKSELLLALLAALAVRHSPDRLNLMLIDFKGAATFGELAGLPHTVGVVSDLEGSMAERALIAIDSQLDERKKLLAGVGAADIHTYRARGLDEHHRPLPNLLIAIDEYDELARDYPDFVAELVRVGKQGRSLGVQLLFVTQQPSAIKDGLIGNLGYRIALRLAAAEDSKGVIGQPDAAYLTSETPGRGYFRAGKDVLPFQSARARAPYRPPEPPGRPPVVDVTGRRETRASLPAPAEPEERRQRPSTELSRLVERLGSAQLSSYTSERKPIWQPPLRAGLTLGSLLSRSAQSGRAHGAPFALLDLPAQASQEPLCFWPGGKSGHLLVVGASGAGKKTLLRTLILALALRYPPTHLWVYTLDNLGGGLGFAGPSGQRERLPHLADSIAFSQPDRVERLILELRRQIVQRRQLFAAHSVDRLNKYIQARASSSQQLPPPPPAILVAIDQIGDLTSIGGELVDGLKSVLRDGQGCGIVVAVTASGRAEAAPYAALCETRIALRLNEAADSEAVIGKDVAAKIRPDQPGRGFLRLGEQLIALQIALPALTVAEDDAPSGASKVDLAAAIAAVQARYVSQAGSGGLPQPLPQPPTRIALPELLARHQTEPGALSIPIGVDALSLEPIELNLSGSSPHLLIAGPPRGGRGDLMRAIIAGLASQYSADEVQFLLVDGTDTELNSIAALSHVLPVAPPQSPGPAAEIPAPPPGEGRVAHDLAEMKSLVQVLEQQSRARRGSERPAPRLLVVINSFDTLSLNDRGELNKLAALAQRGPGRGIHFVVTVSAARPASGELLTALSAEGSVALIGAPADGAFGVRFPRSPTGSEVPPGRGFLAVQGQTHLVQFALP